MWHAKEPFWGIIRDFGIYGYFINNKSVLFLLLSYGYTGPPKAATTHNLNLG